MAFFAQRIDPEAVTRLEALVASDFERMTYTEAIDVLQRVRAFLEFPVEWGLDLQAEHERYLCEEHVGRPVVVTDYPKTIKAFYMRLNDDERTVAAMDVLAPGIGEIVGGSQREERLDVLDRRITEMGLDPAPYWWYRDLRRYGTVPHAGFGLGFDRARGLCHGHGQHPRRHPLPAHAGQRRLLGRPVWLSAGRRWREAGPRRTRSAARWRPRRPPRRGQPGPRRGRRAVPPAAGREAGRCGACACGAPA